MGICCTRTRYNNDQARAVQLHSAFADMVDSHQLSYTLLTQRHLDLCTVTRYMQLNIDISHVDGLYPTITKTKCSTRVLTKTNNSRFDHHDSWRLLMVTTANAQVNQQRQCIKAERSCYKPTTELSTDSGKYRNSKSLVETKQVTSGRLLHTNLQRFIHSCITLLVQLMSTSYLQGLQLALKTS